MSDEMDGNDLHGVILVAEDEDLLRRDICEELLEAGHQVIEAGDGDAVLARLHEQVPDLILCDINMPGRNGYELLRDARAMGEGLADTPFVFLTALSDPREVVDGKRAGADDYLVKPIDFDLLLATIQARLREVRRMRHKSRSELDRLRESLREIGGPSDRSALHIVTRALEPVALGVLVLDGEGQMLLANRAAQRMTAGVLRLQAQRRPISRCDRVAGGWRRALDRVLGADGHEEHVECLRLPRGPEHRELLAIVCALPHLGDDLTPDAPAAVALFSDPDNRARMPRELLSQLFGLTPTEARIALSLAEGLRPADIARRLGVANTTVTFHLRNLFQKTDTHRQAELVALVLSGSMTVALDGT